MKNKISCDTCINWHKVSGYKTQKNERGLCDFMKNRIHTIWENEEPERDLLNSSLVINHQSQLHGEINGLKLNSTSKEWVNRHTFIWTDAKFFCAKWQTR